MLIYKYREGERGWERDKYEEAKVISLAKLK